MSKQFEIQVNYGGFVFNASGVCKGFTDLPNKSKEALDKMIEDILVEERPKSEERERTSFGVKKKPLTRKKAGK
jgi:hypothetical protein